MKSDNRSVLQSLFGEPTGNMSPDLPMGMLCDIVPLPGHTQTHDPWCRYFDSQARCECGRLLYDGHTP
jgi:hypothetical protein